MSCLTAHCHVYPGRSVLCNLKRALNAQPCLYVERRLQREGGRYREINTARKTTAGDWVNCGSYCITGSNTDPFITLIVFIYLWLGSIGVKSRTSEANYTMNQ